MRAALRSLILIVMSAGAAFATGPIPRPDVDASLAPGPPATAVVSGGCFWGIQAVFQHVRGVLAATSGYAGGPAMTAHYLMVETGRTGHAESVRITYDPSKITFGQLLQVFFGAAHDPTQLNRQGPDEGPQYRSVIFYKDADQRRIADAYVAQLNHAHVFPGPIVTRIDPLPEFYPAEEYHQDYATLHPSDPYIVINDAPKVEQLRALFPDFYSTAKAPASR